jgi:hypothetical protein
MMLGSMLASMACARSTAPPPRDPELCEDEPGPKNEQVMVHVVSNDDDAEIERRSIHDEDDWRTVCKAPCDLHLFVDDEYRIGGRGIRPSPPFRLDGDAYAAADLEVSAARASTRTTGTILLGIGAGSAAMSTFVWAIYRSTNPADPHADRATRALLVSFAVDFLLLVPGIALSAASTDVEVMPSGLPASSRFAIVPGGFVF